MNRVRILSACACMSLCVAAGVLAEFQGVQPGTSANPKGNLLKEI